jgi:hypothetical protein
MMMIEATVTHSARQHSYKRHDSHVSHVSYIRHDSHETVTHSARQQRHLFGSFWSPKHSLEPVSRPPALVRTCAARLALIEPFRFKFRRTPELDLCDVKSGTGKAVCS